MQRAFKATRGERRRPDIGEHIYAYCNIRTRQVLYSLHRSLHPTRALKQLPDLGPNSVPPKLRKDVWQPFFTLSLPRAQPADSSRYTTTSETSKVRVKVNPFGLDAFRRLREYRRLHELTWTPPLELSRLHTEEEIKSFQKKLDERGGSKTEAPHDLIKREKKKLRRRVIMDQKANSVADLAATLLGLEKAWVRREEVLEMIRLAGEVRTHGLGKKRKEISHLRKRLRERIETVHPRKSEAAVLRRKELKSMQVELYLLEHEKARAELAANAVEDAHRRLAFSSAALIYWRKLGLARQRTIPEVQKSLDDVRIALRQKLKRVQEASKDTAKSEGPTTEMKEDLALTQKEEAALQLELRQARGSVILKPFAQYAREMANSTPTALRHLFERSKPELEDLERYLSGPEREYLDAQRKKRAECLKDGIDDSELQAWGTALGRAELKEPLKDVELLSDAPDGNLEAEAETSHDTEGKLERLSAEHDQSPAEDEDLQIISELREVNNARAKFEILEHALTAAGIDPTKGDVVLVESEAALKKKRNSKTTKTDPLPTWHALLPSFPRPKAPPVELPSRIKSRVMKPEALDMSDVKVEWANILDAEFAKAWPPAVRHEYMGIVRHIAKKPDYAPKMTASEVNPGAARLSAEERGIAEDEIDEAIGTSIASEAEQRDEAAREAKRSAEASAAAERKELLAGMAKQIATQIMRTTAKPTFPQLEPSRHLLKRVARLKSRRQMAQRKQTAAPQSVAAG